MNGCLRVRSYVNVYPISDSSEAVGHFISVCAASTVPHTLVQKFSHFLKGLITFSPHLGFQRFTRRLDLSGGIPQKALMEHRFGAEAVYQALWSGDLDLEQYQRLCGDCGPAAARLQLEEQLIVLENDKTWLQLDCKAVLWGERAACVPAWLLIDGKIITAVY